MNGERWKKSESTGWKALNQLFNALYICVCSSSPYNKTGTDCNQ